MTEDIDRSLRLLDNIVFLKKTSLFSAMPASDLRAVAAIAEEMQFHHGDMIVRERDVGDSLFLIKEGEVIITKRVDESRTIELAQLHRGDCFGEMAAFDAELRSADAQARGVCVLLRIGGEDLIDVIRDCPSIGIEMLRIFAKRLRAANMTIEKLSRSEAKHKKEAQS